MNVSQYSLQCPREQSVHWFGAIIGLRSLESHYFTLLAAFLVTNLDVLEDFIIKFVFTAEISLKQGRWCEISRLTNREDVQCWGLEQKPGGASCGAPGTSASNC